MLSVRGWQPIIVVLIKDSKGNLDHSNTRTNSRLSGNYSYCNIEDDLTCAIGNVLSLEFKFRLFKKAVL